jgi:hypothetical protein
VAVGSQFEPCRALPRQGPRGLARDAIPSTWMEEYVNNLKGFVFQLSPNVRGMYASSSHVTCVRCIELRTLSFCLTFSLHSSIQTYFFRFRSSKIQSLTPGYLVLTACISGQILPDAAALSRQCPLNHADMHSFILNNTLNARGIRRRLELRVAPAARRPILPMNPRSPAPLQALPGVRQRVLLVHGVLKHDQVLFADRGAGHGARLLHLRLAVEGEVPQGLVYDVEELGGQEREVGLLLPRSARPAPHAALSAPAPIRRRQRPTHISRLT